MEILIRGVRGSLPTPLQPDEIKKLIVRACVECVNHGFTNEHEIRRYMSTKERAAYGGYGGNTSCVQVTTREQMLIIDAGSGIRALGKTTKSPCEIHILISHFHWDHLIGLAFFSPIFHPDNVIHMYAVQPELEMAVRTLFRKPFFPVDFKNVGARVMFHQLEPRKMMRLGDIEITPYELDHPDPCWGFKIGHNSRAFAYCVDTEALRTSAKELGPDLPLYQNIDVMIIDAQYSLTEAATRINWGHSAATIGLDIAMREKIKKVFFVHYDPNASDEAISEIERQTQEYHSWKHFNEVKSGRNPFPVEWKFAEEGELIVLE